MLLHYAYLFFVTQIRQFSYTICSASIILIYLFILLNSVYINSYHSIQCKRWNGLFQKLGIKNPMNHLAHSSLEFFVDLRHEAVLYKIFSQQANL